MDGIRTKSQDPYGSIVSVVECVLTIPGDSYTFLSSF